MSRTFAHVPRQVKLRGAAHAHEEHIRCAEGVLRPRVVRVLQLEGPKWIPEDWAFEGRVGVRNGIKWVYGSELVERTYKREPVARECNLNDRTAYGCHFDTDEIEFNGDLLAEGGTSQGLRPWARVKRQDGRRFCKAAADEYNSFGEVDLVEPDGDRHVTDGWTW